MSIFLILLCHSLRFLSNLYILIYLSDIPTSNIYNSQSLSFLRPCVFTKMNSCVIKLNSLSYVITYRLLKFILSFIYLKIVTFLYLTLYVNIFFFLMFIGPCIIVIVEELKTNLMSLAILFHFLCAQHVSDINISIVMSLRLCC